MIPDLYSDRKLAKRTIVSSLKKSYLGVFVPYCARLTKRPLVRGKEDSGLAIECKAHCDKTCCQKRNDSASEMTHG